MYNESVKCEFISELPVSYVKIAEEAFQMSAPYEEHYKKDICNFIEPEIDTVLYGLNASSINSLQNRVTIYKKYTTWAIDRQINVDHINRFEFYSKNVLLKYINQKANKERIISKDQLFELFEQLQNPSDRYVILGAFEGLMGTDWSELLSVTEDMIHGNEIQYDGYTKHISDHLKQFAIEACNTYTYKTVAGFEYNLDEGDPTVWKSRANARFNTAEARKKRLISRLNKIREIYLLPLKLKNLRNSGIVYEMQKVIDNNHLTAYECTQSPKIIDILRQYDMMHVKDYSLRQSYLEFLRDWDGR